jgi:uncharacterized protein YoxC
MVWEVALVIFLLVLTVLIILLIPTVVQFFKTLNKLSRTLDEVNRELPDILENIEEITDHTAQATKKINHTVDTIAEIEQKISDELKEPALEVIATLTGLFKGLQTFLTYFVRSKK